MSILDKYMAKIPPGAFTADVFYLRPLSKSLDPSKPWYSLQPLGRNTLASKMKMMSAEGGLAGNLTNHSLRAYGASEMLQSHGLSNELAIDLWKLYTSTRMQ